MDEHASSQSDLEFQQFLESHVGLAARGAARGCPRCGCDDESKIHPVEIDGGELVIRVCSECNESFGFDDATDFSALRRQFEAHFLCQTAMSPCLECGNRDVDRFVYLGLDEAEEQELVQCSCGAVMEIKAFWQNFEKRLDEAEDKGGKEGDYGNEIGDEAALKDDQYEMPLVCEKCGKADFLTTEYDSSSKRLIGVKCWGCEHEWSPILDSEPDSRYETSSKSGRENAFADKSSADVVYDSNNNVSCDCDRCLSIEKPPTKRVDERNKSYFPTERPPCYWQCDGCSNNDPDLFEEFALENGAYAVKCLSCESHVLMPGEETEARHEYDAITAEDHHNRTTDRCRRGAHCRRGNATEKPGKTLVTRTDMLRPGDHITWHRDYAVYHHAIVEHIIDSGPIEQFLTVIEYTGGLMKLDGHFASIQRNTIPFKKATMHRVDYYGGCLSPSETLERARRRLGETRYNPLSNNCEHFATWCKTGKATSSQTETLANRMINVATGSGMKSIEEVATAGAMFVANNVPWKQAFKLAKNAGLRQAQGAAGQGATKVAAGSIKAGALALGIGINLAVEAGSFVYYSHQAHQRYRDGKISRDDFHAEQMKLGGESLGGFIGGSVGGFLGQSFIPIPILGSIIGCSLGSIVGRFLGAVIAKKVAEKVIQARRRRLRH